MTMAHKRFKYIYGPVFSWRLGISLGVDPIGGDKKRCTFDCTYCQIGTTEIFTDERKEYVATKDIIAEIRALSDMAVDYITFSGNGEPTLAKNLGDMIKAIRKIRKEKIAVITNASLIYRKDVQDDLMLCDVTLAKLDACSENLFMDINKPMARIDLNSILKGIKEFREIYKGKLKISVMFTKKNKPYAVNIADTTRRLGLDEVQINTPLRPCSEKPLSKDEMTEIKKYFNGQNIISVYDIKKKFVKPMDVEVTKKRHGIDKR